MISSKIIFKLDNAFIVSSWHTGTIPCDLCYDNRKVITTRCSAIAVIADRTACSILTLFIVIATSRPLNKKICSLSVCGSNNYCGSASALRKLCCIDLSARTALACHCWQTSPALSTRMPRVARFNRHLWCFSLRFLWCILWLNDTS